MTIRATHRQCRRPPLRPRPLNHRPGARPCCWGHPEYLYWALILFGVLPLAPINRVAAVVVAARLATQGAYDLGTPEPQTQIVIFGACLMLALHNARLWTCLLASTLFLPMAVAAAWQLVAPYEAWWAVYWIAVFQAVVLICNGEWRKAIRHWLDVPDPEKPDLIHRLVAFCRRKWLYA